MSNREQVLLVKGLEVLLPLLLSDGKAEGGNPPGCGVVPKAAHEGAGDADSKRLNKIRFFSP